MGSTSEELSVHVFDLGAEQEFNADVHVENILRTVAGGDVTAACWEPHQVSPYHCHPSATEIYLCLEGGGVMRTPTEMVEIVPHGFVVHPPGELHEYENGAQRTVLFRVRYGPDLGTRTIAWRGQQSWTPSPLDLEYLDEHPEARRLIS
jgi:mannose-6-phosphate isomerase-like protein (cupin superfamily)